MYLLCIQVIHGFNFALFWAAAVDAIFKLAPAASRNSCMATLNMIYFTLGGIVGNSAAGYIYEYWGSVVLYYIAAFVLALNVLFLQSFTGNNYSSYRK
jgi:predicted MFS family arabinose efflux permease